MPRHAGRRLLLLTALTLTAAEVPSIAAGQTQAQLIVTVVDTTGAPAPGLDREDFRLHMDGTAREVLSVEAVEPIAQVVAIFEGLAATQQQTSAALTSFITSLDDDSIVDMQSVEGDLDEAIVEAIEDLHARGASRPVIVMLGQGNKIVPSELQSSQVRGKRQAADLSGDLDRLHQLLAEHGIIFYGVSVTEVSLANLEALAEATGGRFEVIPEPARLDATLTAIGRELGTQYLVSYAADAGDATPAMLEVTRPGLTLRATPMRATH
jgi:hypothetical protein